jgi:pimeloyl-ACP methyl ester carboxylesterase
VVPGLSLAPAEAAMARHREQSRARYPDATGYVSRADGLRSYYEVYGDGDPAILFVPTWSIVHSRIWKLQIPWFASRHRVITFDALGNGRSDRPDDPQAYDERAFAGDILRVLDATATNRVVLVSLSLGALRALVFAGDHPDRVSGLVFIGPAVPLGTRPPGRGLPFEEPLGSDDGWAKYNAHYWRRDYDTFLEFFFDQAFSEAHSTKPIDDSVGWGRETDPETLIATNRGPVPSKEDVVELAARLRCPALVIQGSDDGISGPTRGIELAAAIPGARLEMIEGGGHIQNARDPVRTNLLIREFLRGVETRP